MNINDEDLSLVAPALVRYRQETLVDDLWLRPDLGARDRSIVTLAALIARNQTVEQPHYLELALRSGVKAGEISEIITHLAFYSGWANALAAAAAAKPVFARHAVTAQQLPLAAPSLLALNEAAEAQRAASVAHNVGSVIPAIVGYTTHVLFRDLWLRPDLAPRDRSLVTVSALIAQGHVAQIPFHLNRAMDNGLTQAQVSELVAHLAFYAGWPTAMSSVAVIKDVFEMRSQHTA